MSRVIILEVNDKEPEYFSSLKVLFEKHPDIKKLKSSIERKLSREKVPYEANGIKITRPEIQTPK